MIRLLKIFSVRRMQMPSTLYLMLVLVLGSLLSVMSTIASPRIAIIGSGAGGSSAAYHLSQLLNNNVEIDVFEKSNLIGGRMASVKILGNEYETGGAVIHPRNKLAVDLVKRFGLTQRKDSSSSITSLLKDSEFVFSTSRWTLVTIWRILYRYGLDFNRIQAMTNKFIDEFENIYKLQDEGISFENVELLLTAMSPNLLNLTTSDFYTFLHNHGYSNRFVTELVQAITYVNYGQPTTIHSLVGHVSVAGASDGLWSVQDGNKVLAMALLNNSNARTYLNTCIESIIAIPGESSFKLSTDRSGQSVLPGTYDKIILAMPWSRDNSIQFVNFLDKEAEIKETILSFHHRKYHRTVSTLVAAKDVHIKYKRWIDIISCTPNFFTSISRVHPVLLNRSERVPVFKVFSPEPLTDRQLHEIFNEIHQVDVSDWLAYPEYDTVGAPLPSFKVLPNIYYLNAIEWAASAIEMSLISGRNAAINIASQLSGTRIQSDEPPNKTSKTEL